MPNQRASRSNNSSSVNSPDSHSFAGDYESPITSAATTPAEPAPASRRKRQVSSALKVQINFSADDDVDLARRLQEEEFSLDDARKGKKPTKNTKALAISDSDESPLSDPPAADLSSSEDEPIIKKRKTSAKTSVKVAKPSKKSNALPDRSARSSAKKAMRDYIVDDEDDGSSVVDSDESEFSSELSEPAPSISTSDEDASEAESEQSSNSTSATPSVAARSRQRARRGQILPRRFGTMSPGRRRRRGLQSRAQYERLRLEHAHPEIKTMWDDLKAVPTIPAQAAEQPKSITRTLKSFQLEGLNWMCKQEQSRWGGGLLGDEMGMGKTIQAVSLIMSDYPQKQPSLVVVPPVALMQWTTEIKEYTDGKLKVLLYHGINLKAKKMSVKELKGFDIIMISYSGLESIYRKETKGWSREDKIIKEDSAIHSIEYHRIILDEAHSIKTRTTGVAKACFALRGKHKWCLSGTPVQNRIGEFFSLLRFLAVTPFANYFCKNCDCSALHWTVDKTYKCVQCKHRSLDHVSVFNQEILNPITSGEDPEARKDAFAKLRLLTDRIMLRRMKRDHTASMELPMKQLNIERQFFGEMEKDFANSIMGQSTRKFDTYVSRGVMLNNYANIFGLIMQMRQVADHPDLITKKKSEGGQNVLVCNICDEPAEDAIRSQCKHEFCRACVKDFVRTCENSGATPDCPRCHIALSVDFDQPEIEQDEENVKSNSIINRIRMENWTSSTKIEMLVYELWKLRSRKQTTKSIVFSQFTSMLQLVEWRLRRAGFSTVMLDGSMSPQQRQKSIEHFMNNSDVEVFLVSLKAGGVALNLTEASRVFLVDPWWSPAAEVFL